MSFETRPTSIKHSPGVKTMPLQSAPCSFINHTPGRSIFSAPACFPRCVIRPIRPRPTPRTVTSQTARRPPLCTISSSAASADEESNGQLPTTAAETQTSAGEGKTVLGSVGADRIGVVFTCTADNCGQRIVKSVRRQSYEKGTVVVKCPKCEKIHVIADHLGMYADITGGKKNIEEIAKAKGQSVTRVDEKSFELEEMMYKLQKDT